MSLYSVTRGYMRVYLKTNECMRSYFVTGGYMVSYLVKRGVYEVPLCDKGYMMSYFMTVTGVHSNDNRQRKYLISHSI